MLKISANQLITVVRGDSFSFPLFINYCDKWHIYRYELSNFEKVLFRVMPGDCPWDDSPIQKVLTNEDVNEYGDIVVRFSPEDTMNLEPGVYWYEAKLLEDKLDGSTAVDTIITRRKFIILS